MLEEDPEMYSKAGIPFTSSSITMAHQQGVIEEPLSWPSLLYRLLMEAASY
jgi:hypothetical protein